MSFTKAEDISMEGKIVTANAEQNSFHIGVKSEKIYANSYNLKTITYDQNSHLIINHGEELIIFNSNKKEVSRTVSNILSVPYINLTFSNKLKCFFLLDANQYFRVYSLDGLIPLAEGLDIKGIRHCIDFLYLDQYGAFLALFADCLKLIYVEINSNHLRSLFSNAYKFSIRQVGSKILNSHYFLQFASKIVRVNQYFILSNCDTVKIIWHAVDRNFHEKQAEKQQQIKDISKGILDIFSNRISTPSNYSRNTVVSVKKICENPQQISFVLFDPHSSLLLCGSSQGELKVYKINMKNIIATTSPMKFGKNSKSNQIEVYAKNHEIFRLKLHNTKPIIGIQMYSPKLILTIGADQYIQVVSYDQMASIQRFRSSNHLADVHFITNSMFLASKTIDFDQYLYMFEISLDYQLRIHHNSQIVHTLFSKETCMLILSDNSLNILKLANIKQHKKIKRNKSVLSQKQKMKNKFNNSIGFKEEQKQKQIEIMIPKQSFVPPRCKSILSVQNYPSYKNDKKEKNKQQFWILTDETQIYRYVYDSELDRFQIIEVHELNQFTDSYNHETKQKIITMKFIDVVPVHFDSDIKQKKYFPNLKTNQEIRPIAFGCQTGQVLICSSLAPNKIISRIRIFAEAVKTICSCYYPETNDLIEELLDQGNGQLNDSIIMAQRQKQKTPHCRRLLIFNSRNEIVAVMVSNYLIPQIIYKLLLNYAPSLLVKNLGSNCVGVASGSSTKILFPSRKNASKLKIWVHSSQIHEAQITCLEYCGGIKSISGDELGKVVLWNLLSEILAVVSLSDRICIELCYCWDQNIVFGHSGKIFQMNRKIIYQQFGSKQEKQEEALVNDETFINQSTIEVSLHKNNQVNIHQLFKGNSEPISQNKNQDKSNVNDFESQHFISQNKSKQLQKYVKNMKKSLVKLAHQNETYNSQTLFPISSRHERISANKNAVKIGKSRSVMKQLVIGQDKIQFENNISTSKIGRAKSILNKFRQIQQKEFKDQTIDFKDRQNAHDISLPQIKNIVKVQEPQDELIKRKKNRNKKYQFLFHFPNSGLYTQLISKNMIQ